MLLCVAASKTRIVSISSPKNLIVPDHYGPAERRQQYPREQQIHLFHEPHRFANRRDWTKISKAGWAMRASWGDHQRTIGKIVSVAEAFVPLR